MPTIHDDGVFSSAQPDGPENISRPLFSDGDTAHRVISQAFIQESGLYAPAQMDSVHPSYGDAYLVSEDQFEETGGLLRWVRTWATIPSSTVIPIGSMSHTFPAIEGNSSGTQLPTITAVQNDNGLILLKFASAHGMSVGEAMRVSLVYRYHTNGSERDVWGFVTVRDVWNSTDLRINYAYPSDVIQWQLAKCAAWKNVIMARGERNALSVAMSAKDYFLPGVTPGVNSVEDISITQPWTPVVSSTGSPVNAVSNTTTPTRNEYANMIARGDYLAVDCRISPYMGNIFVRENISVRAL